MRLQSLLLLALLPLLAAPQKPDKKAPEAAAPGAISIQVLAPLEAIAKQLAKGGREREMKDLLTALEKLGYPQANHEKLEKTCKDELAKAKDAIDSLPAGAKQLRTTARQIVAVMQAMPEGEEKLALARNVLRLDGENEEAHALLGHVKVGSGWVSSDVEPLRKRRGEILTKMQEAKKFELEITTGEEDEPLIQRSCGVKATTAAFGNIELRSNFSVEKTERMLRETVRACVLSNWLRFGKLEVPSTMKGLRGKNIWVLIDSREKYKKLAEEMIAAGEMNDDNAKRWGQPNVEVGGFNAKNGHYVKLAQFETDVQASMLISFLQMQEGLPTPITAGHLNWLALSCFGCTLPGLFYKEEKGAGIGTTFVENEDQKREREELLRMSKAGIAGSRTWMQFLAERGEDPAFARSFVEAIGAISGNDLHKCTSIVEYLHEAGMFTPAYKSLTSKATGRTIERFNAALSPLTVGDLEAKWRDWLLGSQPGVAERIDKENLSAWPKEALKILEYMNSIREKAFDKKIQGVWKLKFDPELSSQCALHAHYLTLHPEQQKWPDAHEEYSDKDGYTPEGHWAGMHSVIVWREGGESLTFQEGIDVWLASFYHRLPLTDPGVMRLGWGAEEIYQVMDMGSLAAPYDKPYVVVYPYEGQTDVETAFLGDEHPDPIPSGPPGSVNEAELYGNPITIQTNPADERGEVVDILMKLFEGKDGKKEVECFFSTPSKPTNPESAPAGCWCLIPKQPLKLKTEYKVVADWISGGRTGNTSAGKHMEWTFKTK